VLFLDFSSAYNHINHKRLFNNLHKVLKDEEVNFLRVLYKKYKLKLGEYSFQLNSGVSPESTISPGLFNIYIESLLKLLNNKGKLDVRDILAYADDFSIICNSWLELRRCINLIEAWAKLNEIPINYKKSSIAGFGKRQGPTLNLNHSFFKKFLIPDEYKYLGCLLKSKLTLDSQIKTIKKKTNFIRQKLGPPLTPCTFDPTQNLWQTFILPLYEFTLHLLSYERSTTNIRKLNVCLRKGFKSFTLLTSTTRNIDTETLIGYNLNDRAVQGRQEALMK